MPNAIRGLHSPSGPALIPLVSHSVQTVVGGRTVRLPIAIGIAVRRIRREKPFHGSEQKCLVISNLMIESYNREPSEKPG